MSESQSKPASAVTPLHDLGFAVEITPDPGGYFVSFRAFIIHGDEKSWAYRDAESASSPSDIERAEVFAKGSVKWDGCANFAMPDSCYHTCDRYQLLNYGKVLVRVHQLAADAMPENWRGESDDDDGSHR